MSDPAGEKKKAVRGRHSDILEAKPTCTSSFSSLVNEIKQRANFAVSRHQYEEAEVLYSHGITLLEDESNTAYMQKETTVKTLPAFYTNRSMTSLSMGKYKEALSDANESVKHNPEWNKGYYRQAQCYEKLMDYRKGMESLERMYQIDPKTKTMKANCDFYQRMEKQRHASEERKEREGEVQTTEERTKKDERKKTSVVTTSSSSSSSSSNTNTNTISKSKSNEDENLKDVHGYKKLADGRVTTYFHNELTEKEKQLIGDITPKRVEDTQQVTIKNVEGGSAWNQGNTFEEKDMNNWANEKIKQLFSTMKIVRGNQIFHIKECNNIKGDAAIAVVRGSKRYIFDFTFTLKCEFEEDNTEKDAVKGTISILDFSSDCGYDYDMEYSVPDRYSNSLAKELHAFLSKEFKAIFNGKAQEFLTEFHSN